MDCRHAKMQKESFVQLSKTDHLWSSRSKSSIKYVGNHDQLQLCVLFGF